MDYTVLMLRFSRDRSIPTYPLEGSFPSLEAALEAGNREIAERKASGEIGFQIHDGNGNMVREVRRGKSHG
jgi:hypothetical protein